MNFHSSFDEKITHFSTSVDCEGILTVSSSKTWSPIKLLLMLFWCTALLSNIFMLLVSQLRNAVVTTGFICNKCHCLLIICFIFSDALLEFRYRFFSGDTIDFGILFVSDL